MNIVKLPTQIEQSQNPHHVPKNRTVPKRQHGLREDIAHFSNTRASTSPRITTSVVPFPNLVDLGLASKNASCPSQFALNYAFVSAPNQAKL